MAICGHLLLAEPGTAPVPAGRLAPVLTFGDVEPDRPIPLTARDG